MKKTSFVLILVSSLFPLIHSAHSAEDASIHRGYQADSLINVFIAQHSFDQIDWQSNIRLLPNSPKPASLLLPGELLGESQFAGYYAYTPVTWDSLSEVEKGQLLDDQRLLPWITWFNGKLKPVSGVGFSDEEIAEKMTSASYQELSGAPKAEAMVFGDYGKYSYKVSTEEITSKRPLHIRLIPRKTLPKVTPIVPVDSEQSTVE